MTFNGLLDRCKAVHDSKNKDYTTNPSLNKFENFDRASEIASWFSMERDKPFAVLIGVKLARLGSLLSSGRKPNNESIEDTFVDLITYAALWADRYHNGRDGVVTQDAEQCPSVFEQLG